MRLRLVLIPVLLAFLSSDQGSPLPGSFTRGGSGPRQAVAVSPRFGPQPDNLSPTTIKASLDYGRLPLYFVANEGQLDGSVAYYVRGKDKSLYFTRKGMTITLANREAAGSAMKSPFLAEPGVRSSRALREAGDEIKKELESAGPSRWAVKLDFVGANPDVRPVGEDRSEAVFSYFRGRPKNWHAGVPAYAKILYRDLWPGIDLAYYGKLNELKYEFIVQPGADPSKIRLAYRGVSGVKISDGGQLEVCTPLGDFRDGTPVAYQEIEGRRSPVDMAYSLLGPDAIPGHEDPGNKESDDTAGPVFSYGFRIDEYDHSQPLVLDPAVLVFCGFIGGSGTDYGYGIDVDASGCVYVAGQTTSTEASFPVTAGPDLAANGGIDAFVAKINPAGTGLVYCGFIGGSGDDFGRDIAVDSAGNAYFTGYTYSTEASFPVLVGPDLTHNMYIDVFVGKLNPAGTALSYCGYIGGWGFDYGEGIAVDGSGNAFVAGYDSSTNFPTVVGPDMTHNGGNDAFVAKVNPSGTGLVYCGHIGGSGDDEGCDIAVDGSGCAYVAGFAGSVEATFPVLVGPDLTYNGYYYDGFIAKVNPAGSALMYCGYIGGSDYDKAKGVDVDASGSAFVTGQTSSNETTFPVAIGPDLSYNGGNDAFVAKVSPSGSGLDYCGYVGGALSDIGEAIAIDLRGSAYITGYAESTAATFPVAVGPDLTHNGDYDAFVAKVNPWGARLLYCGYVGGNAFEEGLDIAVDAPGNAYLCGRTTSTGVTFPVIAGPDLTAKGGQEAFVAKVLFFDERVFHHAVGDIDGDGADELVADLGTGGIWKWNAGAWTQISTSNAEGMILAEYDGNVDDEIFIDLGASGLWLLNNTVWMQWSAADVETMAAGDVDGDGKDEPACDFGALGLWKLDAGNWSQLSGVNADYVITAKNGATGTNDIVGDFGSLGLWTWSPNSWTQLSGVNAEFVTAGEHDIYAGDDVVGDFGALGLWLYSSLPGWFVQSGVNPEFMISADVKGIDDDDIVGDFGALGLWLWMAGSWEQLSGVNPEYMIMANPDGDAKGEIVADFGALGIWLWDTDVWTQLSGVNPETLLAGDFDGDASDEALADFGSLGLWQWDGGAWIQISSDNLE